MQTWRWFVDDVATVGDDEHDAYLDCKISAKNQEVFQTTTNYLGKL